MPCLLDSSHTFEKEGVNENVDAGDVIKIGHYGSMTGGTWLVRDW